MNKAERIGYKQFAEVIAETYFSCEEFAKTLADVHKLVNGGKKK